MHGIEFDYTPRSIIEFFNNSIILGPPLTRINLGIIKNKLSIDINHAFHTIFALPVDMNVI